MEGLTIDIPPGPSSSSPNLLPTRQISNESAASVSTTRRSVSSGTTLSDDYETVDERMVEMHNFANSHLGHGSYGTVLEVSFKGRRAALKMLAAEVTHKAVHSEAILLHRLHHENIIKLYAVYKSGGRTGLLLELMPGGSLHQLLHTHHQVRYYAENVLSWAQQCLKALVYLHDQNLMHRDLKPSNMLLGENYHLLKLCDFGTAATQKTTMTNNRGSAAYMAPEVFQFSKYSLKCDIYSFGICLWEMITRKLPVDDGDEIWRVLWQATTEDRRPAKISRIPPILMEIIEQCWKKEPSDRPEALEVLEVIGILAEVYGNCFKPLIDLTTKRQASASTLNEPPVINYSVPNNLGKLSNSDTIPRKPSAPTTFDLSDGKSRTPPPVPPRPSAFLEGTRQIHINDVDARVRNAMSVLPSITAASSPVPNAPVYNPPYPASPYTPCVTNPRPIGFNVSPQLPTVQAIYQPPYPTPAHIPMQNANDIGWRRSSETSQQPPPPAAATSAPPLYGQQSSVEDNNSPPSSMSQRPKKKHSHIKSIFGKLTKS